MTTRRPYPAYKPSGIEWLGEIPAHWDAIFLKRAFSVQLGKMLRNEPASPHDTLEQYLRAANITWFGVDVRDVKKMWFSPREKLIYELSEGDLLVSEGGDVGRSALWNQELDDCYIQNAINRIRSHDNHSTHYLFYWLYTIKHAGYIDILCNKATIAHFTAEKVAAVEILLPPLPEQRTIAAFLDRETARIDALIAKKQRLIELLQEKRTALISQAVTKGLDPDAPMKDSGVEWIGEIPVGWVVVRFRHCYSITQGQVDPRDEAVNERILIAPNHIESGTGKILYTETANKQAAISGKYLVNSGEIIYSKIRPALNKVCIAGGDWLCSADMYPIQVSERLRVKYSKYYFLSQSFVQLMIDESMRVAMPKVNRQTLASAPILIPPLKDQEQIEEFLDDETLRIDALVNRIRIAIGKHQEYRTALISAAVTGKIDVRSVGATHSPPASEQTHLVHPMEHLPLTGSSSGNASPLPGHTL